MKRPERPNYLEFPNGSTEGGVKIEIANQSGEGALYFDKANRKRNELLPSTLGEDFECVNSDCAKEPQTVCPECNGYICSEHLYRHPNCSEGR